MSDKYTHQMVPQAYLSNLHNRVRQDEDIPLVTVLPGNGPGAQRHGKRAKLVNYAEFDAANELFDDLDDDNRAREDAAAATPANPALSADTNVPADPVVDNSTVAGATLPDITEQTEPFSALRYPRIKETFLEGKLATPYRLGLAARLARAPTAVASSTAPVIVPISINIEHNGHTIQDTFTWNANDKTVTPAEFATIYCRDLDFPTTSTGIHSKIVSAIQDQLQEHETAAAAKVTTDLQVIVNLTCSISNRFYEDNFQWALQDDTFGPEQFAETVVKDLGLTRDFLPMITNALYESLIKMKKEWLEGHMHNQGHVPNYAAFGYLSGIRMDVETLGAAWCPRVEKLTPEEIQKRSIERERNMRRLKRESDRMVGKRGRRSRLDDLETTLRI